MLLTEFLERYVAAAPVRMHMPGHKGEYAEDVTEIAYCGGDVVDAARESAALVARIYGAERAFLLTGGSTLGLLCAITAVGRRPVLIARASHKSVYSACVLSGAEPVICNNLYRDGRPLPLTAEQVREAVSRRPDIAAVVVTSPDYYGAVAGLDAIRREIGTRLLIVDGAHGAHFGLHPTLPKQPCDVADAVICSSHKTLPAMTQTAFALVRERFREAFCRQLELLQTTSPSYVLLASIERAVVRASQYDYARLCAQCRELPYTVATDDATRIVIDGARLGRTGYELEEYFKTKGIVAEFGDERYCVLIATCADTDQSLDAVRTALETAGRGRTRVCDRVPDVPQRVMSFQECVAARKTVVDAAQAVGRIAAAEMGFYPPCTPVIVRGERIEAHTLEALSAVGSFGIRDGITVTEEE